MGIVGKIFGNSNTVDKVIDNAARIADNLKFTEQERAKLNQELSDSLAKHAEATMIENTDRSITRRYISVAMIALYVVVVVLVIILNVIGKLVLAQQVVSACKELYLDVAFVMILAFFFGGYYANSLINKTSTK